MTNKQFAEKMDRLQKETLERGLQTYMGIPGYLNARSYEKHIALIGIVDPVHLSQYQQVWQGRDIISAPVEDWQAASDRLLAGQLDFAFLECRDVRMLAEMIPVWREKIKQGGMLAICGGQSPEGNKFIKTWVDVTLGFKHRQLRCGTWMIQL